MVKIKDIKLNPSNPRLIKDEKFAKLVKSIKDFPKMMELRPLVVNEDNVIIGGNMRFKAIKELGYTNIPDEWVKRADGLNEEETRRFIIADNVGFGEHDWDVLANEWDVSELEEWGMDVWNADINNMQEEELHLEEDFDPIGTSAGVQRVVFIFDGEEEAESYMNNLNVDFVKRNMAWQVNLSTKLE